MGTSPSAPTPVFWSQRSEAGVARGRIGRGKAGKGRRQRLAQRDRQVGLIRLADDLRHEAGDAEQLMIIVGDFHPVVGGNPQHRISPSAVQRQRAGRAEVVIVSTRLTTEAFSRDHFQRVAVVVPPVWICTRYSRFSMPR